MSDKDKDKYEFSWLDKKDELVSIEITIVEKDKDADPPCLT
jgi:hypothetical protein